MSRPYKAFVKVHAPTIIDGWGLYKCRVDDYFNIYVCMTHNFLEGPRSYPYELWIDYMAELPVWAFATEDQAREFCLHHTNRYPLDRQLQILKRRDEFWVATILNSYFSLIELCKASMSYDSKMQEL